MTSDENGELREFLDRRFDGIDRRFDGIDRRFEAMDQRFEAIDRRFDAMDRRFDGVDGRLDRIEAHLARHDEQLVAFAHHFDALGRRIDALEARLDAKIDAGFREQGAQIEALAAHYERLQQEYFAIVETLRRIEANQVDDRRQRESLERRLGELAEEVALLRARVDALEGQQQRT